MSVPQTPNSQPQTGNLIDEIIRLSNFNFERLPMLDIIAERFAQNVSIALPDETQVICEASILQLDYVPLSQIIETLPAPAMIAICSAEPMDGDLMLIYDSTLLLTFVELMLGGSAKKDLDYVPQVFTGIERGFGARLTEILLRELQASMLVVGDIDFDLVSMESDPDSANIAPQSGLCVRIKVSISMAERTGTFEVVMPYDALGPLRPKLAKVHYGDKSASDQGWQNIMTGQVAKANMELEVVVSQFQMPVEKLMNLKPGSVLEIGFDESMPVVVTCEQTPMFLASTGQKNSGNAAIKIESVLDVEEGDLN